MTRSFDPIDLVMLPRTTAMPSIGLLRATLSAAEAVGKLPAPIEEAKNDPKTEQLAKALLAPVMTWKSTGGSDRDEDKPVTPVTDPENQ